MIAQHVEPITEVVFRVFRDGGDVIALFPYEPTTYAGLYCTSYQRIGQHGAADYEGLMRSRTRPATPEEAEPLRLELQRIGYRLKAIKRAPRAYYRRKAAIAATRNN